VSLRHETNGNGTEEALRESEQRYRAVIEQTTEGIFLRDADTRRVLESNAAFQRMLGYSAQELRGMHIHGFVAHDREDIDSVFRACSIEATPSSARGNTVARTVP
jgi:PAS domain S-box-containing protein